MKNILSKASFNPKISNFFSSYLINRQTQYIWNQFISSFFKGNVDVGQRSILSLILSALCIALIFHIFKKRLTNLLPPISVPIILFVDNGLFVPQEKSYEKSNVNLFCSYSMILSLFKLSLVWSLSTTNLKFFTSQDYQKTTIYLL